MNSLAKAVSNAPLKGKTTTANGMVARKSSGDRVVDLFFKAGAMRGQDIIPMFSAALADDDNLTLRLAQWLRDARGGAGERQHFRNILKHLERINHPSLDVLIAKVPELGRWDDLLVFETKAWKDRAYELIMRGLQDPKTSGLVAKWLPREKSAKRSLAAELRRYMELTPKAYRKLLVDLTSVVETNMCAKNWDEINFSHVPSMANTRYRKAFLRNAKESFESYIAKLVKGDSTVKVNVTGLYPHTVLQSCMNRGRVDTTEAQFINAQWKAMPNIGDKLILPMIDVSSSMHCDIGTSGSQKGERIDCMHVSISLGAYIATKNQGPLQNMYLTFHTTPELNTIKNTGDITAAYNEIRAANWGGSTNIEKAFELLLKTAVKNDVAAADMPEYILILSDMQFDRAGGFTAYKMIKEKYKAAGYAMPDIIFWNLNAYDNVPVKMDKEGTALVSGFSTSILKAILGGNFDEAKPMTPYDTMLEVLNQPKYDL